MIARRRAAARAAPPMASLLRVFARPSLAAPLTRALVAASSSASLMAPAAVWRGVAPAARAAVAAVPSSTAAAAGGGGGGAGVRRNHAKSKSAVKKRFRVTGSGHLVRQKAGRRHLNMHKSRAHVNRLGASGPRRMGVEVGPCGARPGARIVAAVQQRAVAASIAT